MVRQYRVKSIINIARQEELSNGRSLCYWPEVDGGTLRLADGISSIKRVSVSPYSSD